ncbi:hypothetical protein BDV28DRAFT_128182 [Aspergillus coremiiformis]|uniref:Uncharacterized protein n=1 Tax=Aspergillus coremiiformis TaxID=138285 RepID=A0A5N6ZG91_9EURO|nr:hypothetical protein BDV28DRAFT_128182 [Aspergillus coremiiformis]
MLFNQGLTADAAATHENDVGPQSESQPLGNLKRHSSPPMVSFATLPTLGLGGLYGRYKGPEIDRPHKGPPRAMSTSPVASVISSDEEYSMAATVLGQSQNVRLQAGRKQSSRPKTSYQLAHPASHARHKRLRLRPKLLLQLQRVSQTPRPLPVLDVLPSTVFLPRLSRKFPTIFRGNKGLGPNDLIVVTSDLYERAGRDIADNYLSSDEEHGEHREVVATICQLPKEDALSKGKAEICLNYGPVWEATPLPNGSYEFVANTENGIQILRWVLRGARNRRLPGPTPQVDTKRFTFSVINPNTRRHPVIATMAQNHLEVFDEYAIPTACGPSLSPTSGMSVISDDSEMDAALDKRAVQTDGNLRTLIIITSIWVAFREGWSHNFTFDDPALTFNAALCPSQQPSQPAVKTENDPMPAGRENRSERLASNGSKHRMSAPNGLASQPTASSDRSMVYDSLSKRSNSTGAAFMERTNRRASGSKGQPKRYSLRSNRRQVVENGNNPAEQSHAGGHTTWAHQSQTVAERNRKSTPLDQPLDSSRGVDSYQLRQLEPSGEKANQLNRSSSTKRCRRRLSSIFDFLTRKHH